MKVDMEFPERGKPDWSTLDTAVANRIAVAVQLNIQRFVEKIERKAGRAIPQDVESLKEFGQVIQLEPGLRDKYLYQHYFIWRKHNVLAWRHDLANGKLIEFEHLFPDDWPEPIANYIRRLP